MSRRNRVNWNAIDWTLSNAKIAPRIGYTAEGVGQVRRRLGKPLSPWQARQQQTRWNAIDWTLTNAEIARRIGYTTTWVGKVRRDVKPPGYRKRRVNRPTNKVNWRTVDWTKRDIDIARQIGRSRERVRQVRRALGKPDSPVKGSRMANVIRKLGDGSSLRGLTVRNIAEALSITSYGARQLARRFGIEPVVPDPRKHHPEQWNFKLPNKTLAEIWLDWDRKAAEVYVSRMRHKHGHSPARWSLRYRASDAHNPAYRRAVKAERRKAAAARARSSRPER